jgi:hypothetical protein
MDDECEKLRMKEATHELEVKIEMLIEEYGKLTRE